jgi:hypothetical protein
MNNEKGIWIPDEILQDTRLDLSVKAVLAVYKYYTIEGELHCCVMTNEQIADKIGISIPTVQRAKRLLKKLKLIKSDGGIKVWYKGYQNDTHNNSEKAETDFRHNSADDTEGYQNDTPTPIKMTPQGYQNDTHNKERIKKEKKENKGTIEQMSNTYNISTFKEDDEDLEYMERYGIGKLSYILQNNDDWLPALEYLQKHPTKPNYDTIEAYWSDNNEYLGYLHNFNDNTLRITV